MSELELQEAMDRASASMRRALKEEWRRIARETGTPSRSALALLDDASRDARAREAAFAARLNEAGPQVTAELTEELIPAELRAAGMRFEWTAEQ